MSADSLSLQPLFAKNFSDLFNSLTNLRIKHDDGLPSKICLICIEKIKQFDTFKIQCVQSDIVLREQIVKKKLVKKPVPKKSNNKGGEVKLKCHAETLQVNQIQNKSNVNTNINSLDVVEVKDDEDDEDVQHVEQSANNDDNISSESDLKIEDENVDQRYAAIVANTKKVKLQFYKSPISKNITKAKKLV